MSHIPPLATTGLSAAHSSGDNSSSFNVVIHGLIQSAECCDAGMLYVRSELVYGRDWKLVPNTGDLNITTHVVTQMAEKLPGPIPKFAWNAPFDAVLEAKNVSGWPQVALAILTLDGSGKDICVAYARCTVPLHSGHYKFDLPLMQPQYSSPQFKVFGFLTNAQPELRDMTFICSSEDRLVLTMKQLAGYIRVSFDVSVQGRTALGWDM